jgi:methyl-accepting chemotaxis protein
VNRVTQLLSNLRIQSTPALDQVNKAVSQLDPVTQSNAAQTDELSPTAQSLSQQATELQALVAKFRTGWQERTGHVPSKPAGRVRAQRKALVSTAARRAPRPGSQRRDDVATATTGSNGTPRVGEY